MLFPVLGGALDFRLDDRLASGSAGNAVLISDTTLGSDAASVDFSSIPATYAHLMVVWHVRGTKAAQYDSLHLRFNADTTAANYWDCRGYVNSTTYTGSNANAIPTVGWIDAATAYTTSWSAGTLILPDYANTTTHKAAMSWGTSNGPQSGTTSVYHHFGTATWKSTSAVNQLTFVPGSNNIAQYSRFTLYGLSV